MTKITVHSSYETAMQGQGYTTMQVLIWFMDEQGKETNLVVFESQVKDRGLAKNKLEDECHLLRENLVRWQQSGSLEAIRTFLNRAN